MDQFTESAPWRHAVEQVITRRSEQVSRPKFNPSPEQLKSGRFLLYYPQENLADGAADQSSNGFFDTNNVPPWDIWVGFSDGVLVSWVPPAFIEAADMGIDVNPEECIQWAR
jgi:hypothetical protein